MPTKSTLKSHALPLGSLPTAMPAVVLVVLHRRWKASSNLRSVLDRECSLPVKVAEKGEAFELGTVYVGDPAQHLTLVAPDLTEIVDDPHRLHGNRTVDLLFHSIALHGKGRMIGVVLSGSLDDGSRGLAAIHKAGGLTMVLTPDLLPRQGMPENAIDYDGPIDMIGSPQAIAIAIAKIVMSDQGPLGSTRKL